MTSHSRHFGLTLPLLLIPSLLLLLLSPHVRAHGMMTNPLPRGLLGGSVFLPSPSSLPRFPDAPRDYFPHFPAGSKGISPGAALRSQQTVGSSWTPFRPLSPGFKWRAGVCGDDIQPSASPGPQPHLRNGSLYYDGAVVQRWTAGQVVELKATIIAHHNGYLEFHLCDLARCGGALSPQCFLVPGACHALRRAWTPECERSDSRFCGPIDREYPTRWYLPCRREQLQEVKVRKGKPKVKINRFGGVSMRYKLPDDVTCKHCVLHFYWVAANQCNAPGIVQYFDGPWRPRRWEGCVGQSGALGGVSRVQRKCGGDVFPEEYYSCADVAIRPKGSGMNWGISPKKRLLQVVEVVKLMRNGRIRTVRKLSNLQQATIFLFPGERVDFLVRVTSTVFRGVRFYRALEMKDKTLGAVVRMRVDRIRPFYLGGNHRGTPLFWRRPVIGRPFWLIVKADGESLRVRLFIRRM